MALRRGAVDVLTVIEPFGLPRRRLGALGNREGDVRLQSQQAAVQIGKGDDLPRGQKCLVLLVQGVFFKLAHMVLAAARRFVQGTQSKGGPLLGLQEGKFKFHGSSSLSSG